MIITAFPVVAYDSPRPLDIPTFEFLVPPGDVQFMAKKLAS